MNKLEMLERLTSYMQASLSYYSGCYTLARSVRPRSDGNILSPFVLAGI